MNFLTPVQHFALKTLFKPLRTLKHSQTPVIYIDRSVKQTIDTLETQWETILNREQPL